MQSIHTGSILGSEAHQCEQGVPSVAQAPTGSGPGHPSRRRGRPTSLPFFYQSLLRTVNHQLDAVYGIIIVFPAVVVCRPAAGCLACKSQADLTFCLWFCSMFAPEEKTAKK